MSPDIKTVRFSNHYAIFDTNSGEDETEIFNTPLSNFADKRITHSTHDKHDIKSADFLHSKCFYRPRMHNKIRVHYPFDHRNASMQENDYFLHFHDDHQKQSHHGAYFKNYAHVDALVQPSTDDSASTDDGLTAETF